MHASGFLYYCGGVVLISVVAHAVARKYIDYANIGSLVKSCCVIAAACGAVNLVGLLVSEHGQVKPGWYAPIILVGAVYALPITTAVGIIFRLLYASAGRPAGGRKSRV
jgi:hypothetical protein